MPLEGTFWIGYGQEVKMPNFCQGLTVSNIIDHAYSLPVNRPTSLAQDLCSLRTVFEVCFSSVFLMSWNVFSFWNLHCMSSAIKINGPIYERYRASKHSEKMSDYIMYGRTITVKIFNTSLFRFNAVKHGIQANFNDHRECVTNGGLEKRLPPNVFSRANMTNMAFNIPSVSYPDSPTPFWSSSFGSIKMKYF